MKPSILFLLVISMIVTWATISFAAMLPANNNVIVQNAQFSYNPQSMIVNVSGRLPNPCVASPHPILVRTAQPNTLMLEIQAQREGNMCIQMLGGYYQLGFDARALKFNIANLQLNPNADYTIVTNSGLSLNIDFAKIQFTRPFATTVVPQGYLTVQAGNMIVTAANGSQFVVDSPLINLQKFVGQTVELEGHVINVDRPVFSLTDASANEPSLMLVTGLSNASN